MNSRVFLHVVQCLFFSLQVVTLGRSVVRQRLATMLPLLLLLLLLLLRVHVTVIHGACNLNFIGTPCISGVSCFGKTD